MKPVRTATIAALSAFAVLAATAGVAEDVGLPDAPGRAQVVESCSQCHAVDVITAQPRSPDDWALVVNQMIGNGATLTDEQYKTVVTYLSANLAPPGSTPAKPPAAAE